jgi:hypothetical protein
MPKNKKNKLDTIQLVGYFAIAVIIISLVNFGMVLTGNVTTGIVNITVETSAAINFTTFLIEFGSGAVAPAQANATLDTSAGVNNVTNGNWTGNTQGLILENIGNINVSVNLTATKNATEYIGGASPLFQFNVTNNETGSCLNSSGGTDGLNLGNYSNLTSATSFVCGKLRYPQASDTIRIDIKLVVPSDSFTGILTNTVTATATATS